MFKLTVSGFVLAAITLIPPGLQTGTGRPEVTESTKNCNTLSAPGTYPDYSPLPVYSVEQREKGGAQGDKLLLQISISPADYGRADGLTRLACKLPSDYPHNPYINALIFDDARSAKHFSMGFEDAPRYGTYLWHLRAHYQLDSEKGSEFLEYLYPEVQDQLLGLRRIKVFLTRVSKQ